MPREWKVVSYFSMQSQSAIDAWEEDNWKNHSDRELNSYIKGLAICIIAVGSFALDLRLTFFMLVCGARKLMAVRGLI